MSWIASTSLPRPLDLLCACLSAAQHGRRPDAASVAVLTDPATDLLGLAKLAGRHCVTPMLAACLADPGIRQRLPADFTRYLEFIHTENRRRNHALRLQLRDVASCLNRIGIEPVLLKGAIRLVDGLYRDPGWRFMRDLDLLLSRARLSDAVVQLAAAGFGLTRSSESWPQHHRHPPPLYRDGDAAVVEIHCDALPRWHDLCPAEELLRRSRPVELDGARVRVPHAVDQVAHLIGHDRFDGYLRRSGTFLLRSVFEAALLCRDEGVADQLIARAEAAHLARCVRVRLTLGARLFPDCIPAPNIGARERVQVRALLAMERFDETGRARRLVWLVRALFGKLLTSPAERRSLASNILSLDYGRRSMQRLRRSLASH